MILKTFSKGFYVKLCHPLTAILNW